MAQIELCLLADAAEKELNTAVREIARKYNLPCWVLEPMVAKLHRALLDGKTQEVNAAKQRLAAEEKAAEVNKQAEEQEVANG